MAILPLFLILSVALSAQLFTHRYNSFLPTSANTQKYSIFHFFPFDIALYVHLASCIGIVHLVPLGKAVARHSILLSSHHRLHTRFHSSLTQRYNISPSLSYSLQRTSFPYLTAYIQCGIFPFIYKPLYRILSFFIQKRCRQRQHLFKISLSCFPQSLFSALRSAAVRF